MKTNKDSELQQIAVEMLEFICDICRHHNPQHKNCNYCDGTQRFREVIDSMPQTTEGVETKSHAFEINGGMITKDRGPHWPDCLSLDIPRVRVLELISQLALSLRYRDEGQEMIQLGFMGKLDYDIDEDA